jgi:hypothetical protein
MGRSDLTRALERLSQARTARLGTAGTLLKATTSRASALGLKFTPGMRVFDRVTGEEGIVDGGTVETLVRPTADRTAR